MGRGDDQTLKEGTEKRKKEFFWCFAYVLLCFASVVLIQDQHLLGGEGWSSALVQMKPLFVVLLRDAKLPQVHGCLLHL